MKYRILIQIIIISFLIVMNYLACAMEEESRSVTPTGSSTPTGKMSSDEEQPEEGNWRKKSDASTISSTTAQQFNDDMIRATTDSFNEVLSRKFSTLFPNDDQRIEIAIKYGLNIYKNDMEYYNFILRVPRDDDDEERQKEARLNELVQIVLVQMAKNSTSTIGTPVPVETDKKPVKWPRQVTLGTLYCVGGLSCLAIAGITTLITLQILAANNTI